MVISMVSSVRTICPYCGVGCGVTVTATPTGWITRGDREHPANRGWLCLKGVSLAETLGSATRLLHPIVDKRVVSWQEAMTQTARRIRSTIDAHGPDAFSFYLSGQLLIEDYYAANKLAKGFLGTANVDTNSRLCMASTVAGHCRAFGADAVPGCYDDLETADLVVLVGSNLAWCHPVLFQRLRQATKQHGTRVVVIDPRKTESCTIANLHIPIAPGGDVALFNGLLLYLHRTGHVNQSFIARHTRDFSAALEAASDGETPLSADVACFYHWFAITERVVTVFSQGINQSSQGTDKVNAIINVHLATGRIGRPSMGPFSITGQPNAMGGREVGGFATQLAAHMGFNPESVDRVRRFWQAPQIATHEGLKAVDLFRAIDDGQVRAVWIIATNPAVSQPDADRVRRALARCPVVIVSDCVADTDTLRQAHISLPALAWGEKDGTVTNSDRTLSRQRPFLPCPGEARADWQAIACVARALGYGSAFSWRSPSEVFNEYARLTAFENKGSRALDLSAWIGTDYETLQPSPWGGARLFTNSRFFHKDGRARFVAVHCHAPRESPCPAFPLRLNSGRYRDQWHTMTRTGLAARLFRHRSEPRLDMHPADSVQFGLKDNMLVRVVSRYGDYVARVCLTTDQRLGEVFLPLHWNDVYAARAVSGRLYPAYIDPISGQPELKHVPVHVHPYRVTWHGLLICADLPMLPKSGPWWVRQVMEQTHVVTLAGDKKEQAAALVTALDDRYGPSSRIEGINRASYGWVTAEKRLSAVLFLSPQKPDITLTWVAAQVGKILATPADCTALLAGRAAAHLSSDATMPTMPCPT
ncbi:Assimilatory nitrate reductase large subunit [invertebrate metagenome]|uniref:Assimilatory nitrate reductase large subunit n=1 Tax=invertebrate metagenome TaxID=1711999 RepID=A0A484HBH8_9ZZZZ